MTDTETVAPVQKRKPGRPPNKPAAERSPQRLPQRAAGRTKTGRVKVSDDPYFIDADTVAAFADRGLTLQWNRRTYVGMDDRKNMVNMGMNGWESVDGKDLPQFGVPSGEIDVGGLVLQMRPIEMTEEAVEEDYDRAVGQVKGQLNRLNDIPDQLELNRPGQERRSKGSTRFGRGEPIPVRGDDDYVRAGE